MSATHTTHMNLSKPDRADLVSVVNDLNNNLDIIDDKYGAMETMRIVPYSIGVGDWTLDGGVYKATFSSAYITATSKEFAFPDESYISYAKAHIIGEKHSGGGGWDFQTSVIPTGTIKGSMYVFDAPDGKVPVLIEDTVVSIANGGTGQSTLAGAKSVLGITALSDQIAINNGSIASGNWNSLTTGQRFYYTSANSANWTNKPPYTGAIPAGIVIPIGSRIIQIAITSGGVTFVRTSSDSGSTWASWNSLSAYSEEVSGTTSAAGTLQISDLDVATHRIVSIVPSSNVIALPIRWGNTANSKWGISFRNYSDYSAVASTSVSATVYYEYI